MQLVRKHWFLATLILALVAGFAYLALSGEVRADLRGPVGLVGFYDAGYVGPEEFHDGSGTWISGAGIGLRYNTGFGPLRVDLPTPVDGGPGDAADVQLYIGIGPTDMPSSDAMPSSCR